MALPSSEISRWMVYFSLHPFAEDIERNEWAFTRQMILKTSGKWKDVSMDKFLLRFGNEVKRQTQEEIDQNLAITKAVLTNGT